MEERDNIAQQEPEERVEKIQASSMYGKFGSASVGPNRQQRRANSGVQHKPDPRAKNNGNTLMTKLAGRRRKG